MLLFPLLSWFPFCCIGSRVRESGGVGGFGRLCRLRYSWLLAALPAPDPLLQHVSGKCQSVTLGCNNSSKIRCWLLRRLLSTRTVPPQIRKAVIVRRR